jgi:hypothetical protein
MRVSPGTPDLAASLDGTMVVMASPGRLTLFSPDGSPHITGDIPDGEPDVGFVGERLIAVVRADEGTHLLALNLPSLEVVAQLELEDRLRLVACVGMRALVTNENFERPRIVTVTTVLVVEPIALHHPIIFAAPAPEERLLVASRGREQQLECWDPAQRRALFRLNLPLMPKAHIAGFAHRRRLLWIAGSDDESFLELYRYSDGRLQARAEMGGSVLAAVGHPESPRLVLAVKPPQGPLELVALDFAAGDRHELTAPVEPQALCVAEGATPALVVHGAGDEAPHFVPLARAMAYEAERPPPPVLSRATRTAPAVTTIARGTTAPPATTSTPPLRVPLRPTPSATPAPAPATDDEPAPLPREGTWRDQLCDWSARLVADPRRPLALSDPDEASRLADIIERLELDARSTRAVALLYGARLQGEASLPAALVARALGNGAAATEREWDEALGRGALAALGLARARGGRLRLRPLVARFLDGAPPALTIIAAGDGALATPSGATVHEAGEATLEQAGATLAARFGCDVALVPLPSLPSPEELRRQLERALLEAQLHGAWPLVSGADPAAWLDMLSRLSSVIVVRGAIPPSLSNLPRV